MSSLITLNSSNVSKTQNNVYQLNFPSGSVVFDNAEVAVSSIIIPYSWYNISSTYNNQSFTITMPTGTTNGTLNITIPQGFYSTEQINSYIQSQLLANNYYLVNASSSNVYYIEIVANLNLNVAQINCYAVPTALPVGYTNPGGWTLPTVSRCPQITISASNNFGLLIGFNAGTYPVTQQSTTQSFTSQLVPQITPVTSLYVGCSLVNNQLSNPTNILANIGITSKFATQLIFTPSEYLFLPILNGTIPNLQVIFYDQNYNNLPILDTNLTINLLIKHK